MKVIIILFGLLMLFPAYWMFNGSLQDIRTIMKFPPKFVPARPSLNNYVHLFSRTTIPRWFLNTVAMWAIGTTLSVFCVSCASYSFAFFDFKFKRLLYWVVLVPLFIDGYVLIIPRFLVMNKLGMVGTWWPVLLVGGVSPVGIVMLMHYFKALPRALLDAARMDGLTEFGALFRIILPNCAPLIGYFMITGFSRVYMDILWPLMTLPNRNSYPMTLGVMNYLNQFYTEAGQSAGVTGNLKLGVELAGGVVLFLPLFLIFVVFQRTLRNQFVMGGIKE